MIFTVLAALESDDDRDYLLRLYNDYYARMSWTIFSVTNSKQDLDDLVNDTLLMLVPHIELLRRLTPGQRAKYIRMTVKSVALRHTKKINRETAVSPELLEPNIGDTESPEDTTIRHEEHTTIRAIVSRLPHQTVQIRTPCFL